MYPFKCIMLDSYTHPQSYLIGRLKESVRFGQACKKYIREHKDEIDVVYNDGWQMFGLYIVAHECVKQRLSYIVTIQDIYPKCLFIHKHYPSFAVKLISMISNPIDKYYQRSTHTSLVRSLMRWRIICQRLVGYVEISTWY